MENQFVTLERAAKELCVHVATVRRWVREGRVPAVRMGRKYLIDAKVFEGLVKAGIEDIPQKASPAPPALPLTADQELLPLWLQFDRTWYRRLYLIASKCSLSAARILTDGMELVLKEHNEQKDQRAGTGETKSS
jgi:excisionase family DNA binding protein